jgi:hypothetical protein
MSTTETTYQSKHGADTNSALGCYDSHRDRIADTDRKRISL